jgi:hypothetical protein
MGGHSGGLIDPRKNGQSAGGQVPVSLVKGCNVSDAAGEEKAQAGYLMASRDEGKTDAKAIVENEGFCRKPPGLFQHRPRVWWVVTVGWSFSCAGHRLFLPRSLIWQGAYRKLACMSKQTKAREGEKEGHLGNWERRRQQTTERGTNSKEYGDSQIEGRHYTQAWLKQAVESSPERRHRTI